MNVDIPEVPWSTWWRRFRRDYRATRDDAQHVTIIGPNGTGKSTIAVRIAELRPWVFALAVKPRDVVYRDMLTAAGFRDARRGILPPPSGRRARVVLWPPMEGEASKAVQQEQFAGALDYAFRAGVWHALVDEGQYMASELRLAPRLSTWLKLGRSNGNGMILCVQRPAWMPRDIYSAPRHLLMFGTNDDADLRSIAGLNGVNNRDVREAVARLGRTHRFLHVDTGSGTMAITRYEKDAS